MVFEFNRLNEFMFPLWFFIVLMITICYLLYLTRTTEETFSILSKKRLQKIQYWVKEIAGQKTSQR